jgi:hypothetical protein
LGGPRREDALVHHTEVGRGTAACKSRAGGEGVTSLGYRLSALRDNLELPVCAASTMTMRNGERLLRNGDMADEVVANSDQRSMQA